MSAGFDPNGNPTIRESHTLASEAHWRRLESRRLWWWVIRCGLVGAVAVGVAVWWVSGGVR